MISVTLDRAAYAAGDTITATVSVRQAKPLSARGLYASLSCTERRLVKTTMVLDKYEFDRDRELGQPYSSHMETKTEERQSTPFSEEKEICGEHSFSGGETFSVQFLLPQGAPPTSREFGHDDKMHVWRLKARLDIPFAIDQNAEAEVFVEGL